MSAITFTFDERIRYHAINLIDEINKYSDPKDKVEAAIGYIKGFMSLFGICPLCGSNEWLSHEKDDNGVNLSVQCSKCGAVRDRKYTPVESIN